MSKVFDIYCKELTLYLDGVNCNLSKEQSIKLGKAKEKGSVEAREILYNSCLRLVINIANRFRGFIKADSCFTLDDLVQEGNVALSESVDSYDYRKGLKFSTFAYYHIKQVLEMTTGTKSENVRQPAHIVRAINRFKKIARIFYAEFGWEPSASEIAKVADCYEEEVLDIMKLNLQRCVSVNDKIGGYGEDLTFMDIADRELAVIDNSSDLSESIDELMELVAKLKPRDRDIITAAYLAEYGNTLDEVAQKYERCTEWARQQKKIIRAKLKKSYYRQLNRA